MPSSFDLKTWLVQSCGDYAFKPLGIYQQTSPLATFPLHAEAAGDLTEALRAGGHLLPLPTEPAALANVLEVSMTGYLLELAATVEGLEATKGSERGYPDVEFTGILLEDFFWAVDVKVAQRKRLKVKAPTTTQSRITLYTGNTYFAWPSVKWPGTLRPFAEYEGHLDIVLLYTFDETLPERVRDLEVLVHEPWRIGSRQRSSTTREYIGAVDSLDKLQKGEGEFRDEAEFYDYWRKYKFKISQGIQQQLQKLLTQGPPSGGVPK